MPALPQSGNASPRARALLACAIATSAIVLTISYWLPTVTFRRLGSEHETYSIFGGIRLLWDDGNWFLSIIVFLFSMVFPVFKLLALAALWLRVRSAAARARTVEWLRFLGKWSMLDVFIIGAFVGAVRLGFLADASSRVGIHVFAAAILLSMTSTLATAHVEFGSRSLRAPTGARWPARVLSLVTAAALWTAFSQPILRVEKGVIFKNSVALPSTSWDLVEDGELLLAAPLLLFVLGTATLRSILVLWLRFRRTVSTALQRVALLCDEWAMLDVYGLGLVVVYVKLDQLTTTTLLPGFWIVLAAAGLAQLDAFVFRRQVFERG